MSDPYADLVLDVPLGRRTLKWTHYMEDVLPAWVAEMDFPLAPMIRDALVEAIQRGETGYPPVGETLRLPLACAAWLERCFGLRVEPDHIFIIPNVLRGLEIAIEVFSRSESPVVLPTPSYPPFFDTVAIAGRQVVEVPMLVTSSEPSNGHGCAAFDLDTIDSALGAGAGTVILCNPHNPLGRSFRREELVALSEMVERRNARVVADEVHAPLTYPGHTHVPYASISTEAAHHSVTLTSASKGWNVPGLKCAQIILTNPVDREIWSRLSPFRAHGASILGIVANTVAYEEGEAWLEDVVRYLDGNRLLLADLLLQHLPAVRYTPPDATYLAWLDCRALELPGDPAEFFLVRGKVGLSSGLPFGASGAGFVRLNFATSRTILTAIVERMGEAVAGRK